MSKLKFNVYDDKITPPSTLEQFDQSHGTQTQEAYIAAIAIAPELAQVAIRQTLHSDNGPQFHKSKRGLSKSQIFFPMEKDFYRKAVLKTGHHERFEPFLTTWRDKGVGMKFNQLVVSILLHELGHANDFAEKIRQCSGDPVAAIDLSNRIRLTEEKKWNMSPEIKRVENMYRDNTDGFRDSLMLRGITEVDFYAEIKRKKEINGKNYAKRAHERVADEFALGVLATVHTS